MRAVGTGPNSNGAGAGTGPCRCAPASRSATPRAASRHRLRTGTPRPAVSPPAAIAGVARARAPAVVDQRARGEFLKLDGTARPRGGGAAGPSPRRRRGWRAFSLHHNPSPTAKSFAGYLGIRIGPHRPPEILKKTASKSNRPKRRVLRGAGATQQVGRFDNPSYRMQVCHVLADLRTSRKSLRNHDFTTMMRARLPSAT